VPRSERRNVSILPCVCRSIIALRLPLLRLRLHPVASFCALVSRFLPVPAPLAAHLTPPLPYRLSSFTFLYLRTCSFGACACFSHLLLFPASLCSKDVKKPGTLAHTHAAGGGKRTPMRRGLSEGEKQGGAPEALTPRRAACAATFITFAPFAVTAADGNDRAGLTVAVVRCSAVAAPSWAMFDRCHTSAPFPSFCYCVRRCAKGSLPVPSVLSCSSCPPCSSLALLTPSASPLVSSLFSGCPHACPLPRVCCCTFCAVARRWPVCCKSTVRTSTATQGMQGESGVQSCSRL
jgi:hypothetical protein